MTWLDIVKKQRQPPNAPQYVHVSNKVLIICDDGAIWDSLKINAYLVNKDEYSLLQQRAKRESFETMQHIVNELNNEVSEKVHNLTISVKSLGDAMMGNVSAVTSAWDQLNQDVCITQEFI